MLGTTLCLLSAPLLTLQSSTELVLADGRKVVSETSSGEDGQSVRDGQFRVTSPEGIELVAGEFEDGERAGRWVYRHRNGERAAVGRYKDGLRVGPWSTYWPDGSRRGSGKFRKGAPTGMFKFFYRTGEVDPVMSGDLRRVSGTSKVNGVSYEGCLLDGALHGVWRLRWPDGSPMYVGAFARGRAVGDHRFGHVGGLEDAAFTARETSGAWVPCLLTGQPDEFGDLAPVGSWSTGSASASALLLAESWKRVNSRERKQLLESAGLYGYRESQVSAEVARDAARWAMMTVAEVDWSEGGTEEAVKVALEVLEPVLGGWRLGWTGPGQEGAAEANALALLRAHTVFTMNSESPGFWILDAQAGDDRGRRRKPDVVDPQAIRPPILSWLNPADRATEVGSGRRPSKPRRGTAKESGSAESVGRALAWLAATQAVEGGWNLNVDQGSDRRGWQHPVGSTGLALAAFIHAGHTHAEGDYQETVASGLRWLISQQGRTGCIGAEVGHSIVYDHSIATWVISMALQESPSPMLRRAVELAVPFLLRGYSETDSGGGWRYRVPANSQKDVSVTTWAVRALLAAEQGGVQVPTSYKIGALAFIANMTNDLGRVGYTEAGSVSSRVTGKNDQFPTEGKEPLTACGMLVRSWLGDSMETADALELGTRLLLASPPKWDPGAYMVDFYYWFMSSGAMAQVGGKASQAWRELIEGALTESQRMEGDLAGSWDPVGPWCYHVGRVYATAMAALALCQWQGTRESR